MSKSDVAAGSPGSAPPASSASGQGVVAAPSPPTATAAAAAPPTTAATDAASGKRPGLSWIVVRIPRKQRKGVLGIVSMALVKHRWTDHEAIAKFIKEALDRYWGGFPCWNVFIGKEFTYHISFSRGTAGVLSFGESHEYRVLLYKSAPYFLPDSSTPASTPDENAGAGAAAAATAAGESGGSSGAAGAEAATAAAADGGGGAAPATASSRDDDDAQDDRPSATDERVLATDMSPELLAAARKAVRRAHRLKHDPVDQADVIKQELRKVEHLYPESFSTVKPGSTEKPIKYKAAGIHVIIGRTYKGVHEVQPGTLLEMRLGGLRYTIFSHSIPPVKRSSLAKFLEVGTLIKLVFALFFLAWLAGYRPFGFGPTA